MNSVCFGEKIYRLQIPVCEWWTMKAFSFQAAVAKCINFDSFYKAELSKWIAKARAGLRSSWAPGSLLLGAPKTCIRAKNKR
jgi:hypothetical protein